VIKQTQWNCHVHHTTTTKPFIPKQVGVGNCHVHHVHKYFSPEIETILQFYLCRFFLLWTWVPFLNDFVNFNNRNIYISRKCPYHILCETIYRRNFPSLLFRMAGVGDTWISCNKRSSFKVAFDVLVHFSCSCVKLRKPNKMGPQIHLLKGSHAVG
jgi:hypothetical protein